MNNLLRKLIVKARNQRRIKIRIEGRKVEMDNRKNRRNIKAILS